MRQMCLSNILKFSPHLLENNIFLLEFQTVNDWRVTVRPMAIL
jgi:hypothetical protein